MGTLTYDIPTVGLSVVTEDPKIRNALTAYKSEYNNNIRQILGQWKPLHTFWGDGVSFTSAALAYPVATSATAHIGFQLSGSIPDANNDPYRVFYWDPADYAISGYNTRWRIVYVLCTNSVAPAVTITMGVALVVAVAGSGAFNYASLATPRLEEVTFASPAASTRFVTKGAELAAPAAGHYSASANFSSLPSGTCSLSWNWQLYYRHV